MELERIELALRRLSKRDFVCALADYSRVGPWVDTRSWVRDRDHKPPFQRGGNLALLEAIEPDEFLVWLHRDEHGFQAPQISADILGLRLERVEAILDRLVQRGLVVRTNSYVIMIMLSGGMSQDAGSSRAILCQSYGANGASSHVEGAGSAG